MGIKVRSKWRLFALVAGLALLVLTVPAQAVHVEPDFVGGSTNCANLPGGPSDGTSSFTIEAPVTNGPQPVEPGVIVTLSGVNRTAPFTFTIEGGEVYDVIVKGSGSNWYHYDNPVTTDSDLVIPNGNKLNLIHFCYSPGVDFPDGCVVEVTEEGETATGTFTRTSGNCDDAKRVIIGVENDIVTFIPTGGDPNSTYTGVITFTKDSSDSSALKLQYDPNGGNTFVDVPDCDPDGSLPVGTDTWCVVSASAEYQVQDADGNWIWIITWNVYGEGDPRFH